MHTHARRLRPKMNETTERYGVCDIIEEFLNNYRNEPCLGQLKSKLIEQYRKLEANANLDVVVKKMNALRTNDKENRKIGEL